MGEHLSARVAAGDSAEKSIQFLDAGKGLSTPAIR